MSTFTKLTTTLPLILLTGFLQANEDIRKDILVREINSPEKELAQLSLRISLLAKKENKDELLEAHRTDYSVFARQILIQNWLQLEGYIPQLIADNPTFCLTLADIYLQADLKEQAFHIYKQCDELLLKRKDKDWENILVRSIFNSLDCKEISYAKKQFELFLKKNLSIGLLKKVHQASCFSFRT